MRIYNSYEEAMEAQREQDVEEYYNDEEEIEEDSDEDYEQYRDDMIRQENGW